MGHLTQNPVCAIIQHVLDFFYGAIVKPITFVLQIPRLRRRAVELYARDTPFKGRAEKSKIVYSRKVKHRNKDQA